MNDKTSFLLAALDDAQQIIRGVDAKAAFLSPILIAVTGLVVAGFNNYIIIPDHDDVTLYCLFGLFVFISLISLWILIKTVSPRTNPSEHVHYVDGSKREAKQLFYLSDVKFELLSSVSDKPNNSFLNLHTPLSNSITEAESGEINLILAHEVEKVSYLRELKIHRFRILVRWATCVFILGGVISFWSALDIRAIKQEEIKQKKAEEARARQAKESFYNLPVR